jgi:hypothetical protein
MSMKPFTIYKKSLQASAGVSKREAKVRDQKNEKV